MPEAKDVFVVYMYVYLCRDKIYVITHACVYYVHACKYICASAYVYMCKFVYLHVYMCIVFVYIYIYLFIKHVFICIICDVTRVYA